MLFKNSHFPSRIFHTSFAIVTVEDNAPIDNAIVDGIVNYTSTNSDIDVFGVSITSAFVHALKPDFSDWIDIYWPT